MTKTPAELMEYVHVDLSVRHLVSECF